MSNLATIDHNELAEVQQPSTTTANMLMNPKIMEQLHNFAVVMSKGGVTVPQHLKGNVADCLAIAMQSAQWGMNPFAIAQKTHLVNGTLGYEAQLVNAVVSSSSAIKGRFKYEWFGDWSTVIGNFIEKTSSKGNKYSAPNWKLSDEKGLGIRISATLKGDTEPTELNLLLTQAQVRNSTLWASDPKQQLAYLAVKRWARLYCPDVILGVYTPDEVETRTEPPGERDVTPTAPEGSTKSKKLVSRLASKAPVTEEAVPENEQPVDHSGTIKTLIDGIAMCNNLQDLETCGEDIASVGQSIPKDQMNPVRKAFVQRRNDLEALEAGADPQTGEAVN